MSAVIQKQPTLPLIFIDNIYITSNFIIFVIVSCGNQIKQP